MLGRNLKWAKIQPSGVHTLSNFQDYKYDGFYSYDEVMTLKLEIKFNFKKWTLLRWP